MWKRVRKRGWGTISEFRSFCWKSSPSISDKLQASKGEFSEGGFGGGFAGGDDDDGGVDRRASDDGHMRLSEPSRVSPEEAGRGVDNIKN